MTCVCRTAHIPTPMKLLSKSLMTLYLTKSQEVHSILHLLDALKIVDDTVLLKMLSFFGFASPSSH